MAIRTYSLQADGARQLSSNFKVREFRCKDGSDRILIDDALVDKLQQLRTTAGWRIEIVSGYRTQSHNSAIGGSKNSKHTQGMAADIRAYTADGKSVSAKETCCRLQDMGADGIGYISATNVHLDVRCLNNEPRWWADESRNNKSVADWYSYFGITQPKNLYQQPAVTISRGEKGDGVKWLQWELNRKGYMLAVDGSFGPNTDVALRDYQKKSGLTVDGRCGPTTRSMLCA